MHCNARVSVFNKLQWLPAVQDKKSRRGRQSAQLSRRSRRRRSRSRRSRRSRRSSRRSRSRRRGRQSAQSTGLRKTQSDHSVDCSILFAMGRISNVSGWH